MVSLNEKNVFLSIVIFFTLSCKSSSKNQTQKRWKLIWQDEFNYSTNPTFTNASGRIRVVDQGQEDTQRSFTFPTTVGLHDEFGNLLAVAKLSRPIEKNDERDVTFRVRLDF